MRTLNSKRAHGVEAAGGGELRRSKARDAKENIKNAENVLAKMEIEALGENDGNMRKMALGKCQSFRADLDQIKLDLVSYFSPTTAD